MPHHSHQHHDHHHNTSHSKDSGTRRLGWVFWLNASFTVIEFIGGWLTQSTAIMADAVHDLGDTLAIGTAWLLQRISQREADPVFTYGYRRLSLLGALINSVLLIVGSLWILTEALERLSEPRMPMAEGMVWLALLGILVNGWAALRLRGGQSLNERVLNWHLLEDVLSWVAVLIVAITLLFVDWPILDPLLSIAFTAFILINVSRTLWMTGKLFVQAAPEDGMARAIQQQLEALAPVAGVHHLHLWSLDGEHHVLTAHVELAAHADVAQHADIKQAIAEVLASYSLSHTTIELEFSAETCRDHRD